ncbi:EamA family transporter [Gynuella sp.]|uniref:EamA family transporter n=1 Tax=Gynuella sp. TaxID=2969146 RepID=UPI003D0B9337
MKKLDVFLLVALMALWGLNFSVIKLGVNHVEPLLLTAMRFAFASFPLILFIKRPAVPWRYLMAYGLSFGVGVWGLTTLAVYAGTSAGMASLLLDMSVISSLLVGYVCLNERITQMKLIGSAFALVGLAIIIRFNGGAITTKGLILVLLASVCWSVNGLIVKRAGTRAVFAFNIWAMAFAPVPLVLLASWVHGPQAIVNLPGKIDAPALFSALFQAYPTTLLGYWFWNKMVVKYGVSSVAPMTLLVPVFGLLGGYLFYQEQLILPQVFAAALILTGLMIGELRGWRRRHPQPERLQSAVD